MFKIKSKYLNKFIKFILIFLNISLFLTLISCNNYKKIVNQNIISKKIMSIQQANNLANLIHAQ
ncbi:MAG: hypothetical protein ACR2HS_03225, partial [Gammaproteobacteria bacterium]